MKREFKATKKPVTIEAFLFNDESKDAVATWVTCNCAYDTEDGSPVLRIQTLEGVMTARFGDYIIKGVKGEFYPCEPSIFKLTYDF